MSVKFNDVWDLGVLLRAIYFNWKCMYWKKHQ